MTTSVLDASMIDYVRRAFWATRLNRLEDLSLVKRVGRASDDLNIDFLLLERVRFCNICSQNCIVLQSRARLGLGLGLGLSPH